MTVKEKVQSLLDYINDSYLQEFTDLTTAVKYAVENGGGAVVSYYLHNLGIITPMDGFYNSHSYQNLYIIGNELVILYRCASHHFTKPTDSVGIVKARVLRMNLTTYDITISEVPAMNGCNYWGSVKVGDNYYIFDQGKTRLVTSDFETFTSGTYTIPSGCSEPYYIVVGDNNRLISTHSTTTKGAMMYSDDLGVTWFKATGDDVYNATITTHGVITKIDDVIIAYCQNQYKSGNGESLDNTTTLNILKSTDNGLTWTGSAMSNEDMMYCGPSLTSGKILSVNDDYFCVMSSRLLSQDDNSVWHIGSVKMFKGAADDVINGTMSLWQVVDDGSTGCTTLMAQRATVFTDVGNIGMIDSNGLMYVVYSKPYFPTGATKIGSDCQLNLAIVNTTKTSINEPNDYFDEDWTTERDAFVSAQDTDHDLYVYVDGSTVNTNMAGTFITSDGADDYLGHTLTGHAVKTEDIEIPFTDEFKARFIGTLSNTYAKETSDGDSAYRENYCGINVNGSKFCVHGSINSYEFNSSNSATACGALEVSPNSCMDIEIEYKGSKISVKINGVVFDEVESDNITTVSVNETTNTFFLSQYWKAKQIEFNTVKDLEAIKALTIDTDSDVSDYKKVKSDLVTDGLVANFEVTDLTKWNGTEITDSVGGFKATGVSITGDNSSRTEVPLAPTTVSNGMADVGGVYCESTLSEMGITDGMTVEFVGTLMGTYVETVFKDYSGKVSLPSALVNVSSYSFNDNKNTRLAYGTYSFTMTIVDGLVTCYRNGVLKYTATISSAWSDVLNGYLSQNHSGFSACSDVHIYNRVLTEAEILQNYNYECTKISF